MYRPARAYSIALCSALRALIVLSFVLPVSSACTPVRTAPIPFSSVPAIWAGLGTPAQPQVLLFRGTFETTLPFQQTELQIFADTRYEVWVDGQWIGRGPARFLKTWREYDIYQLSSLQSGKHLIAVLVQWAPNIRRSESVMPFLKAQVQGQARAGVQLLAATSPKWRCLIADAWRPDSAPVDTRGLIGPTELLDLGRLPPDWMLLTFREAGWAQAVEQDTSFSIGAQAAAIEYTPRSIPHLVNIPVSAKILDAGILSPDLAIGEIPPAAPSPYTLNFVAAEPTVFTIETSFKRRLIQKRFRWIAPN